MGYIVAVDSGGTFSDCVVIDHQGRVTTAKAPSTPQDFSVGVLNAVAAAAEKLKLSVEELFAQTILFAHGTTVATNALLTRTGARTALLTTAGHEDVLHIGRTFQKVAGISEDQLSDVAHLNKPEPLIPRDLVWGLHERVDWRGEVVAPLNEEHLAQVVDALVARGVEAVAVSLLWSFANPGHEQRVRDYIRERYPHLSVTLSSDLAPILKEYERTATTAINAYLSRTTGENLERLHRRLQGHGLSSRPMVMQSSGGVIDIERAKERAVALLTSGPAGGVIGAKLFARLLGHKNVITTDVGGTSFDVGLLVDGEPLYADYPVFEQYQILFPVIDVSTVGAGGGSIAWLDHGLLRVGPRSAGADPGPACYGLGGTQPTVTDANVVLGRLNPDYFLGGRRKLHADLAREAIEKHVARPLGLSVEEAAAGIIAIADAHMADLIRKVTIERGYDPRDFVVYAYGGAGPVHAGAFARDAGCRECVVPLLAAAFSAFGIAGSDLLVVEELSEPRYAPLPADRLEEIYRTLTQRALQELRESGAVDDQIFFERFITMRYKGQVHELRTPVPDGPLTQEKVDQLVTTFEELYERRYGRGTSYRQAGIQALNYRVHAYARLNPPQLAAEEEVSRDVREAMKGTRSVFFSELGRFEPTPVYQAELLRSGDRIAGPAVVEAVDTTIVIHPGQTARVDGYRNVIIAL